MRNDRTVYLKDYRQTDFIIESVDLVFELGEELTTVGSQIRMKRRPGASPEAPLEFVGDGLQLAGLALDGKPLLPERYECTSDHLTINDLPADDAFTYQDQYQSNRQHPASGPLPHQ